MERSYSLFDSAHQAGATSTESKGEQETALLEPTPPSAGETRFLHSSEEGKQVRTSFTSLAKFKDIDILPTRNCKSYSGPLLRGPRKVLRLCLFGLILPGILITIPLYVRLILYPPERLGMAPTDQRLLSHRVSSIWCQSQTVQMNGSFNAYLLPDMPEKKKVFSTHSMVQHLTLKDDVKEYWGFFLLEGSVVSINLCARYDGAMMMLLRGAHNLHKCAWIGEEDSAEQDEDHFEESNESGEGPEVLHEGEYPNADDHTSLTKDLHLFISPDKEFNISSAERESELDHYIRKLIHLSKSSKDITEALDRFRQSAKHTAEADEPSKKGHGLRRKLDHSSPTIDTSFEVRGNFGSVNNNVVEGKNETKFMGSQENKKTERIFRLKRSLTTEGKNEADEESDYKADMLPVVFNSSLISKLYKVDNWTEELYKSYRMPDGLLYEKGIVDQNSPNDTSNEEHRSSFSSSEEALMNCKGLLGSVPILASRKCQDFTGTKANRIIYKIPVTGTYYFVFSSDNEVFNVDFYMNLTMQKVVYDTDNSIQMCRNQTHCSLSFSFWSHDKAVIEIPENGNWDSTFIVESKCDPRVSVYLVIIILVPILIMFCALS